jgi:hypothetical protein
MKYRNFGRKRNQNSNITFMQMNKQIMLTNNLIVPHPLKRLLDIINSLINITMKEGNETFSSLSVQRIISSTKYYMLLPFCLYNKYFTISIILKGILFI